MGWRNIAFTCLDDATTKIEEARTILRNKGPSAEDLVLALLSAQEALHHAIEEAVADGVPSLVKPIEDDDPAPVKTIVHILENDRTLCGQLEMHPTDRATKWPEGHGQVSAKINWHPPLTKGKEREELARLATCRSCLAKVER